MLGMVPGIDNKKKIFKMKDHVLGSRNKIQYQQDTQDWSENRITKKNGQKSKNVHANLRLKTEAQSLTLDKDEDIDTSIRW